MTQVNAQTAALAAGIALAAFAVAAGIFAALLARPRARAMIPSSSPGPCCSWGRT